MIPLPAYINPEAWAGFEEMRKTIKCPLTDRARTIILAKLQKIKDAGHCPNASLDQSTERDWRTVFEPRELEVSIKAPSTSDERIAAEKKSRDSENERVAEYIKRSVRRVA
jgi:hypothetical protein